MCYSSVEHLQMLNLHLRRAHVLSEGSPFARRLQADGTGCAQRPLIGGTTPGEQRAAHLRVGQLDGGKALVGLLHAGHVVLARAVLRVRPRQGVLVAGQDSVEVGGRRYCGEVGRDT